MWVLLGPYPVVASRQHRELDGEQKKKKTQDILKTTTYITVNCLILIESVQAKAVARCKVKTIKTLVARTITDVYVYVNVFFCSNASLLLDLQFWWWVMGVICKQRYSSSSDLLLLLLLLLSRACQSFSI